MKRKAASPKRPHVRRLSIDIDKDLWSKVDRIMKREDRTIRSIVERAFRREVKASA